MLKAGKNQQQDYALLRKWHRDSASGVEPGKDRGHSLQTCSCLQQKTGTQWIPMGIKQRRCGTCRNLMMAN